jgi:hypothetical protein
LVGWWISGVLMPITDFTDRLDDNGIAVDHALDRIERLLLPGDYFGPVAQQLEAN